MSFSTTAGTSRTIEKLVPATDTGKLNRLIGTLDIDGQGTDHPLAEVDPFILLDESTIPKNAMPPFGAHPHRGHSVVTILTQGKYSSWDSFRPTTSEKHAMTGHASYWVDAGSGVFHDEQSIIENEDDPTQHCRLFQLWVGVKQEDRLLPPKVQIDNDLPSFDCKDPVSGTVVGKGIYHVGPETKIVTPHPIVVAYIRQEPNTVYHVPVDPTHAGFVVHIQGQSKFGEGTSTTVPTNKNDVLVLSTTCSSGDANQFLRVETNQEAGEYLVCTGEPHGEKWAKKLVANGAIIAATAEEARALAPSVETMAASGKAGKSFAPFGME
ncbi:pirin domain protein [Seminavis robusta]|uniref:Pirin domain protein n=1 Tax=Seminavis robusta TaxID=568900 RepID=A0A9N8EER9_9STRA|nr:pirin domain protein [Seminavis robusta]|eukprot:Sro986_g228150.1 pirin domain protein (324) ;mRNA; r:31559-32530